MYLNAAVQEYLMDCNVRRLSARTIHNYRVLLGLLTRFINEAQPNCTLEFVKSRILKGYLIDLENRGRKPQYINDNIKVMKGFFNYCVQENYLHESPMAHIHNVRQPKVLIRTFTEAEIRRMLSFYSGSDFLSIRNRTMIALFFDTGMRLNEVLTLCADQILNDRILVHGKGSKERLVPVSPYLAKLLIKYDACRHSYFHDKLPSSPCFFVSRRGLKLTPEAVTKFLKAAASAANVREDIRVSPHTCRHTFAHLQLKNGLDLYSLSRLMGHENIAITQRYLDGIRTDEVLEKAKGTFVLQHI